MRIGNGYDVHKLIEGRELTLGGVIIPYEKGLQGHSDADVLAHSIMDALLGASCSGNIGKFFPDTDEIYKDISSLLLLKMVVNQLDMHSYKIINIDCIIVAQNPKLSPYIDNMRENLANACDINASQISIKATTEEGLGFTGTGEGIACHSVCLID